MITLGEARRPWTTQVYQSTIQEDQAIRDIVSQLGTKHWSDISQQMQDKYNLFGRSGKQCRQRWHNHLAPDVNKRPWTKKEEELLFEAHKRYGNKWTEISKQIQGRTDNAIKNYFYSSIRRSFRRINKVLGSKNSTIKMRSIKPTVLSTIFNLADREEDSNFQHYKDLTTSLIQFSRNRVKKQKYITEQYKTELQNLIKKLMQFNDLYQKDKKYPKKSPPEQSSPQKLDSNLKYQIKIQQTNNQDINYCHQQQQLSIHHTLLAKKQTFTSNQSFNDIENYQKNRINLEESEYDWNQFHSRCETIVNRYLLSQNSLKSMENISDGQINQNSTPETSNKNKKTPIKSQKQTLCSTSELIIFDKNVKNH